jgi:hypothetical protein
LALFLGVAGVGAALAGPAAYALDTVATPHAGAIPSAGPAVQGGLLAGPGGFGGGSPSARGLPAVTGGRPTFPANGFGSRLGLGHAPGSSSGLPGGALGGTRPGGATGFGGFGRFGQAGRTGGAPGVGAASGFLNAGTPGKSLVALLDRHAGTYRWVAATVDSNAAAGYQLATDDPVMAIGGFNGTDPAPTLAQFESYVSHGDIHYFIASGGGFAGGGGFGGGSATSVAAQITSWVKSHYTARTVDGVTVYDLTAAAHGG